jgi:sec-independent protein translocase protein TatA
MANFGWAEILLVLLIVLLLFGATRLPKLSRSMGQSIRGFKQGLKEDPPADDEEEPGEAAEAKSATPDKDASDDESDPPAS